MTINPSWYKGPNLALKTSEGPVLACCRVPMHPFTMFHPVLEQTKHKFGIIFKNNILSTGMLDMF